MDKNNIFLIGLVTFCVVVLFAAAIFGEPAYKHHNSKQNNNQSSMIDVNDFVSLDIALKLKNAGYTEAGFYYYNHTGNVDSEYTDNDGNAVFSYENYNDDAIAKSYNVQCTAPTVYQAQKWLRDNKHIVIGIIPEYDIQCDGTYDWRYWYKIYSSTGNLLYTEMAETYEHALECAIDDTLDYLILKQSQTQ